MRSQVTSSLLWLRQRQAYQALPTCPAPMLPALPEPVSGLRQRLADLEAQLAAAGQGRAEQDTHTAGAAGGAVQRTQQGQLGSAGETAGDPLAAARAASAALGVAEQQLGECQRESGATRDMVAKQAAAAASAEDAKAAALAEASFCAESIILCQHCICIVSSQYQIGPDL